MKTNKSFLYTPRSVIQARRFVSGALEDVPDSTIESAILIVSELATNAIRHAGTGFSVDVEVLDQQIRVSVTDSGGGRPQIKSPPAAEPSGRGLRIVELLSDHWGIDASTAKPGKSVWFTINFSESFQVAR